MQAESVGVGAEIRAAEGLATKHRFDADGEGVAVSGLVYRKRLLLAVRLRAVAGIGFQFWTLTFDPWPFVEGGKPAGWESWAEVERECFYHSSIYQAGCYRAYVQSRKDRFVACFMRDLRDEITSFEYVAFTEFQQNGMPHYHVLIFKHGRVNIDHDLMLRVWGRGGVRFSEDRGDVEAAGRYATKYLVKGIRSVEWMPDAMIPRYMRFVSASRRFWGPAEPAGKARHETAAVGRPETTLGDVRRGPARWRKVMLRLFLSTGEVCYRHVKMSMSTCVEVMGDLGMMGGAVEGKTGKWRGRMQFAGRCSFEAFERLALLDYLPHCDRGGGDIVALSG